MHQAQPTLKAASRHPPALLLAAPRHPAPCCFLRDAQHLRRCRRPSTTPCSGADSICSGAACPISSAADAGRGDALGAEPPAGEGKAEEVRGSEEASDVEQRVVRDAVAERARRIGAAVFRSFCANSVDLRTR